MNNGEVGGSRGRGRGWPQSENPPRELRRPKIAAEDAKGRVRFTMLYVALSRYLSGARCDVVILGQFCIAFLLRLQVKVRIFISNDVGAD